jgi:moderate conductance mechanosensitive channel
MSIDPIQLIALQTAKTLFSCGVILVLATIGFRLWRSTLRRIADRLQARRENQSHERKVRLNTLVAVGQATGAVLLGVVAGLMVLGQFADISPLLAGASVVGLAIGLGSKSLIRDVIAGFFILLEEHFGVGDHITVNDKYAGRVEHLDLRRTVLRNIQDGSVLTIPNGEIRVVANTTKDWSQLAVDIRVDYAENLDRFLAILEQASRDLCADPVSGPKLVAEPDVLGVQALGESDVTVRVMLKTQPGVQAQVGRRYRGLVKTACEREGVSLGSQQGLVLAGVEPMRRERPVFAPEEVVA